VNQRRYEALRAVRNLEEFRSPNTGIRSPGWKQALHAFTIYFDRRIPTPAGCLVYQARSYRIL